MSDNKSQTSRTILQYWACNMTLLHDMGITNWPGFTYTEEERKTLAVLGEPVSATRYLGFVGLNALYFIILAGIVVGCGVYPAAVEIDPHFGNPLIFFILLGGGAVICLGLGLPISMALTSLTLKGLAGAIAPTSVSDHEVGVLYRKMLRQFVRAAVVIGILFVPGILFYTTKVGFAVFGLIKKILIVLLPLAFVLMMLGAASPRKKE